MNNLIWNEKLAIMYRPNLVNIRLTSSIASASSLVLVIFSSLQELGLLESLCFTNRWLARTYKIRGLDPYKCVYAGFRQVLNIARLKFKRIDYHKLLLIKIYPYQCYWAVTNKQVFLEDCCWYMPFGSWSAKIYGSTDPDPREKISKKQKITINVRFLKYSLSLNSYQV